MVGRGAFYCHNVTTAGVQTQSVIFIAAGFIHTVELRELIFFSCMQNCFLLDVCLFVVYLTTLFQYLRLYSVDFYSSRIRLPSSSEAGEMW
jgi:hypothetical protein